MQNPLILGRPARLVLRVALSDYVTNGLSVALGLILIAGGVGLLLGPFAASIATVGVIVCVPPDQAGPKRGKFRALLPAAVVGLPLFYAVQVLHERPLELGLLLVPATFLAFLAGAWGRRGLPIVVSIMFAMLFSMAVGGHAGEGTELERTLYFALGSALYLIYATLANAVLNRRYRVQILADALLALGDLMHTQAEQFTSAPEPEAKTRRPLIGRLLHQEAALADQLQTARNILLESPRTARRQRLAGMLMQVLEMRDHLLACQLDLDTLRRRTGHEAALTELRAVLGALAEDVQHLADALLVGRKPAVLESRRPRLLALSSEMPPGPPGQSEQPGGPSLDSVRVEASMPSASVLMRGLASRIAQIDDEAQRLVALARGKAEPDLAVVRAAWQMFVSPTAWSWRPFFAVWRWDAPPLRHAIRAALAIGTGYALSLALPWAPHGYWILLTIAVVLRGSLAQTIERRNARVTGTLVGCILAAAILSLGATPLQLLVVVTGAQAVAHAFAVRRYLVTAVAATVLSLVQAHLLAVGANPTFDAIERMADTLIGVAIAWAFSYVLPSWERTQIPALVSRTLSAQARHARVALGLGQLQAVDNEPELEWRLARREAYDSLSALVQATQRSLAEPRAVRPPLESLGRLLAHSHQLLAQLTAVKSMLLLRRGHLEPERVRPALEQAARTIEQTLDPAELRQATREKTMGGGQGAFATQQMALPDPFETDLSPWLLRRLHLATDISGQLREDAQAVLEPSGP